MVDLEEEDDSIIKWCIVVCFNITACLLSAMRMMIFRHWRLSTLVRDWNRDLLSRYVCSLQKNSGSEWNRVRMDQDQNGPGSEWTKIRMDPDQNGPGSEWTRIRMDPDQNVRSSTRQVLETKSGLWNWVRSSKLSQSWMYSNPRVFNHYCPYIQLMSEHFVKFCGRGFETTTMQVFETSQVFETESGLPNYVRSSTRAVLETESNHTPFGQSTIITLVNSSSNSVVGFLRQQRCQVFWTMSDRRHVGSSKMSQVSETILDFSKLSQVFKIESGLPNWVLSSKLSQVFELKSGPRNF